MLDLNEMVGSHFIGVAIVDFRIKSLLSLQFKYLKWYFK